MASLLAQIRWREDRARIGRDFEVYSRFGWLDSVSIRPGRNPDGDSTIWSLRWLGNQLVSRASSHLPGIGVNMYEHVSTESTSAFANAIEISEFPDHFTFVVKVRSRLTCEVKRKERKAL